MTVAEHKLDELLALFVAGEAVGRFSFSDRLGFQTDFVESAGMGRILAFRMRPDQLSAQLAVDRTSSELNDTSHNTDLDRVLAGR